MSFDLILPFFPDQKSNTIKTTGKSDNKYSVSLICRSSLEMSVSGHSGKTGLLFQVNMGLFALRPDIEIYSVVKSARPYPDRGYLSDGRRSFFPNFA